MTPLAERYPYIVKATELVLAESGNHLLQFYGFGPSFPEIVEKVLTEAAAGYDEVTLNAIEVYLASLSEEDFEKLAVGDCDEAEALGAPHDVTAFLDRVFDAEKV